VYEAGGLVIMTTPAAWSDGLLKFMARVNLVSAERSTNMPLRTPFRSSAGTSGRAGFEMKKVKFGYFEFMLNMWARRQSKKLAAPQGRFVFISCVMYNSSRRQTCQAKARRN